MPVAVEPNVRIKKTTVTEVLPPDATGRTSSPYGKDFYDRDFWEVVSGFTTKQWEDHLVRVYRADERWEKGPALEGNKFTSRFSEDDIRERWGGGRYKLWMYGPPNVSQIVMPPLKLELEGQPKSYHAPAGSPGSNANETSTDMLIRELLAEIRAGRGGNIAAESMKQAMDLNVSALRTGLDGARAAVGGVGAPTSGGFMEDMQKQLFTAVIGKMLNPSDPIEQFIKMAGVMKETGLFGTPAAAKVDTVQSLLAALPSVLDKGVQGMKEYRLAAEAQARAVDVNRVNRATVIDAEPQRSAPTGADTHTAPPNPQGQNVGAPTSTEVIDVEGPSLNWVLLRVVAIVESEASDGNDLYDFLLQVNPSLIVQLGALSPEQIMAVFTQHPQFAPILGRVAANPKLPAMINQFLEIAKQERDAAAAAAPKPV